jgi:hypothetical protein
MFGIDLLSITLISSILLFGAVALNIYQKNNLISAKIMLCAGKIAIYVLLILALIIIYPSDNELEVLKKIVIGLCSLKSANNYIRILELYEEKKGVSKCINTKKAGC